MLSDELVEHSGTILALIISVDEEQYKSIYMHIDYGTMFRYDGSFM